MTSPLTLPPSTATVVLSDYSQRPGDVMTFTRHAPPAVLDGERALVWRAPNGSFVVTIGFVDDHPWYPVHRTTVLLCDESGTPRSGVMQPGSQLGIVDHRAAAETWWRLTAPQREKWEHVLAVLRDVPVDAEHAPQIPVTDQMEGILRLTLPWIPIPVWPEWCRRMYMIRGGVLVHASGRPFTAELGKAPPTGMLEVG